MQLRCLRFFAAAATVAGVVAQPVAKAAASRSFGPSGCVSLSRSDVGSCVITTACEGKDISNFDFSFRCVTDADRAPATHSLGVGSFDEAEDFDTDVKCQECLPPGQPVLAAIQSRPVLAAAAIRSRVARVKGAMERDRAGPQLASRGLRVASHLQVEQHSVSGTSAGQAKKPKQPREVYGPNDCVSVWRDKETGTCVMETNCMAGIDLSMYDFGMICLDKDEEMTRHLFGTNSFGPKETFDTLIECAQCEALDQPFDGISALAELVGQVKGLKDTMTGVNIDIDRLEARVFPNTTNSTDNVTSDDTESSPAPAPAPVGAPGSAPSALLLTSSDASDVLKAKRARLARGPMDDDDDSDSSSQSSEDGDGGN